MLQQLVYPGVQHRVRALFQEYIRHHSRGMGESVPVHHVALGVQPNQPRVRQQHVDVHHPVHVHLPVIAHQDKVGLLINPRVPGGLNDVPQPAVRVPHRLIHMLVEQAVSVAHAVDVGRMIQQ